MKTQNEYLLNQRADIFDACYSELSKKAQRDLNRMVERISDVLGHGAGEKSAKELIVQTILFNGSLPKSDRFWKD